MMRRAAFGLGTAVLWATLASEANAQVHIDVGVHTPPVIGHVVLGPPHVHVIERHPLPVYAPYARHHRFERGKEIEKREREYLKEVREARREYAKAQREAEREYWKDVREAQREAEKDRREAAKDRRQAWRGRR